MNNAETKKKKKEKRKYSRIGNIVWAVKNLWKIDKRFCLMIIPTIPFAIMLSLAMSYFPKLLINMLDQSEPFGKIAAVVVVFFAVYFLICITNNFLESRLEGRRLYFTLIYQGLHWKKYATTDYENLENQEFKKIDGYAMRDLTRGNPAVEFVWYNLREYVICILGIITIGAITVSLNPIIFAAIIATSVVSYFLSRWQQKYRDKNKSKWEKEERKKSYIERISEDFTKAKEIKLYGMGGWIDKMIRDYQNYVLMWEMRCSLRGLFASILSGLMTLIQNGIAYVFIIGMLFAGEIGVGDFVFYFGIVGTVASYLNSILQNSSRLMTRGDQIGYVREHLNYEDKFNHGKGCPLPTGKELPVKIEFRDVWYKYDGAEDYTLKGVTLTIGQGEKLALVGMNGAGKTTLIKLLCGFYTPTKGEIFVAGKPIREYNIDEYYSLISAVFQDIKIPALTICEFVGVSDTETGIDRERAKAALSMAGLGEKIDSLDKGIDTYLRKGIYPDAIDLSGGENQKLLLARAIYKNGDMLLLDEPTAALDPIAENELYLKYNSLTKDKTSIYISHRFASTRFCDRIALLDGGVIEEIGTHDELMAKNGKYAYMFGVQSKYYKEGDVNA